MTEKISLAKETKQILQENGIILNKNLGQNYLIDDFKRKKIIEYAKITKEDGGCSLMIVTKGLCADPEMAKLLGQELDHTKTRELIYKPGNNHKD
mgnify:CR=1 FL=1